MWKVSCFLMLALLLPAIAGAFPSWEAVGIGSHDVRWTKGGSGTLTVSGTFGGTTVTFFYCAPLKGPEACFEVDATACTFTAAGTCDFFKGPGDLRLVIAGGAPSINAVAAGPTQASAGGLGSAGGVSGLLDGPVLFGGPTGEIAQDPNFVYDFSTGDLALGPATAQLLLPSSNDAVTPTLAIGNGDTGLFEAGSKVIGFSTSGILQMFLSGTGLSFVNGPVILDIAPSSTVPSIVPLRTDTTTGVGGPIGEVSLIVAGTEMMRATANGVGIGDGFRFELPQSPDTSLPAGVESAIVYDETNDVVRVHDGASYGVLTPKANGELTSITYVLDAAISPNQTLHVTLTSSIGTIINTPIHCYLSNDSGGVGESSVLPDSMIAGTNQFVAPIGTTLLHTWLGPVLGVIDVTFNESSGTSGDSYFLACIVNGGIEVSPQIIPKP